MQKAEPAYGMLMTMTNIVVRTHSVCTYLIELEYLDGKLIESSDKACTALKVELLFLLTYRLADVTWRHCAHCTHPQRQR